MDTDKNTPPKKNPRVKVNHKRREGFIKTLRDAGWTYPKISGHMGFTPSRCRQYYERALRHWDRDAIENPDTMEGINEAKAALLVDESS